MGNLKGTAVPKASLGKFLSSNKKRQTDEFTDLLGVVNKVLIASDRYGLSCEVISDALIAAKKAKDDVDLKLILIQCLNDWDIAYSG